MRECSLGTIHLRSSGASTTNSTTQFFRTGLVPGILVTIYIYHHFGKFNAVVLQRIYIYFVVRLDDRYEYTFSSGPPVRSGTCKVRAPWYEYQYKYYRSRYRSCVFMWSYYTGTGRYGSTGITGTVPVCTITRVLEYTVSLLVPYVFGSNCALCSTAPVSYRTGTTPQSVRCTQYYGRKKHHL
jgi:hypothetical protein